MKSFTDLGMAVASRRRQLGMKQFDVARKAGITPESLSRFERGHLTDLGARKLLALLAVLSMELQFVERGQAGSLDELRKERGGK
jgi:HTH-type transcriptional regulator / antitoxin HipB